MSISAERCEQFRLAFAEHVKPHGWKYIKSRQALKKQVKDLVLEVFLGTSWHNSAQDTRIRMWFMSWCKSISKKECQDASAIGFYFTPSYGNDREWWQIGPPEEYERALEDAAALFERTLLPLSERFEQDYEATVWTLATDGYSAPCIYSSPIREHTAFCMLQYASRVLGKLAGQQAAKQRYEGMPEPMRNAKRDEIKKYMDNMERARTARANGIYFVDSDVMYLVDQGMLALGNDGGMYFPTVG